MKKYFAAVLLSFGCATTGYSGINRNHYRSGDYVISNEGTVYRVQAISGDTIRLLYPSTGELLFINRDSIQLSFLTADPSEYITMMVLLND